MHLPPPISTLFPYTTLFRSLLVTRSRRKQSILRGTSTHSDSSDAKEITSSLPCRRWQVPCRRSEEHTSELQSRRDLVCRLLLEKKKLFLPHTLHELIRERQ